MNSDEPLKFDPNEPVTAFATESLLPLRRPPPPNRAAAPAQADQKQTTHRPSPYANASIQENTPKQRSLPPDYTPRGAPRANTIAPEFAARPTTAVPAVPAVPAAPAAPPTVATPPPYAPVSPSRLPLTHEGKRTRTPDMEDITLPSNFVGYEWKDIQARRFSVEEIRAVVRARTSGNLRHLVRAVDATLSRPVSDMTVGDFWFMMYWHRLHSYKKSPFVIEWSCNDSTHLDWVANGRTVASAAAADKAGEPERMPVAASTLKNTLTVDNSNLNVKEIDVVAYQAVTERLWQEYNELYVRPQNLADFVAASEEDDALAEERRARRAAKERAITDGNVDAFLLGSESEDDEERGFMYRYAAVIHPTHGDTLMDRANFLNHHNPDVLVDLEELVSVADHGVEENWTVYCKECGASRTVNQSLDALTFLPSLQRGGSA